MKKYNLEKQNENYTRKLKVKISNSWERMKMWLSLAETENELTQAPPV